MKINEITVNSESTPVSSNYLDSNTNAPHEIEWLKKKILSLQSKYEKRPRTIKQIRDLERQIKERGGMPDKHNWLPSPVTEEMSDQDPFINSEIDPKTRKVYGVTQSGEKIEVNDDPMDKTTATFDPLNGIQKPTEVTDPNKPMTPKPGNPLASRKIHDAMQKGFKQPATPIAPRKPGAM